MPTCCFAERSAHEYTASTYEWITRHVGIVHVGSARGHFATGSACGVDNDVLANRRVRFVEPFRPVEAPAVGLALAAN